MALNAGKDRNLEVDLLVSSGVAALQRQSFGEAREAFEKASQLTGPSTTKSQPTRRAAISNNVGVLATLTGDARSAGAAFQAAGDAVPLSLGRSLTQPLNPGTASALQRPMGAEGLGLLLGPPTDREPWLSVSPGLATTAGAEHLGVFAGDRTVRVKLQGDAAANLAAQIYEPRIHAPSLQELSTFETIETNFLAYLPHTYGFTLPLSLGDCYVELGELDQAIPWYEKARDYRFLNKAIEAPVVWLKLANAFLRWGDLLFESGQKEEAKARYEQIVRLAAPAMAAPTCWWAAAAR
jgi:tetratricopeptide (TPR) repeat protein